MNKNLRWIRDKITFVFDNEKEFIDRFFECYNVDDLLEFYMASERCKVILILKKEIHHEKIRIIRNFKGQ